MMKKKSFFLASLFFIALFSFFSFSCKKNNGQLEMPQIKPGELSPRTQWALISDPYVACRKEASYESATIASFRKGEIYEITGNCTIVLDKGSEDEIKEKWYALGDGWVPSSAVKVYSNKLKAEQAKKSIK
ncbi:hypothetical protein [uncultured Treponema sp.]|uniref:hypothetical protein n=1 Tax=uncultured Treponema sp. TaxID=162155 RepID=UPI002639FCF1|nr:hypothetical protein [uncultured Treponema sp.]